MLKNECGHVPIKLYLQQQVGKGSAQKQQQQNSVMEYSEAYRSQLKELPMVKARKNNLSSETDKVILD